MAYEATTWRWPDSTFGKQKYVPFADNQQYPDCGPQRIYTLENILYGLEKVITPLLQAQTAIEDTTYADTAPATETPLDDVSCLEVTIYTLSTATENLTYKVNGGAAVILEKGYSVTIKTDNAQNIRVWQPGAEGDDFYYIIRTLIP